MQNRCWCWYRWLRKSMKKSEWDVLSMDGIVQAEAELFQTVDHDQQADHSMLLEIPLPDLSCAYSTYHGHDLGFGRWHCQCFHSTSWSGVWMESKQMGTMNVDVREQWRGSDSSCERMWSCSWLREDLERHYLQCFLRSNAYDRFDHAHDHDAHQHVVPQLVHPMGRLDGSMYPNVHTSTVDIHSSSLEGRSRVPDTNPR